MSIEASKQLSWCGSATDRCVFGVLLCVVVFLSKCWLFLEISCRYFVETSHSLTWHGCSENHNTMENISRSFNFESNICALFWQYESVQQEFSLFTFHAERSLNAAVTHSQYEWFYQSMRDKLDIHSTMIFMLQWWNSHYCGLQDTELDKCFRSFRRSSFPSFACFVSNAQNMYTTLQ